MLRRFRSSLFARVFAITTLSISVVFVVMYALSVPFIQSTVAAIEERSGHTILDNVYEMAEKIRMELENSRQTILAERKTLLRNVIQVVAGRAHMLGEQVRAGKLPRQQAKKMLLEELRHINYGRNDYVFASDYHSVLLSHPDPELNGADFSLQKDTRGNLIVPPMVEGALRDGDGYYSYWWRRLGEQEPSEKLSYYKNLPEFDLVVGTGVYLDDVEVIMLSQRALAIEKLRQRLLATHIAKTGYVYIFDSNDFMLIHPNANIEGVKATDLIDYATGKPLFPMLKAVVDQPKGLRYQWDSPADPGHYTYSKISWIRYVKGLDWYIGSSVYVDELDASALILRNRVLTVFVLTLLLSIGLIYILVKRLTDPLRQLSDTAQQVQAGDLNARCKLNRDDEIGVVALTFNAMVLKLQDNIRHLDDKVMQRTSELAKAYEELKQLDQLKSDFLSTVSHELRTPMTSIVGFVKLVTKKLEKTVFPQLGQDPKTLQAVTQVRENLDIIIAENERLTLLINDVLDSVKLEADEVEWNFVPLQPQRLIERATASTAALIKQSRLKFTSELEPDLPVVQGDEDRLLQVLVNLLGNAIKFTDSGQIGLRAQRQGGLVRFSVQDSGRGIAEKDQGRVFDKFKQIGETLTGKPTGTGLGLSICHQIITRHGGSIGLESSVGTGSTFYFTLPVAGPGVAVLQN